MLLTPNPLQEKMTLFWSSHFTSSVEGGMPLGLMVRQNNLFRRFAPGNFAQLTHEVARDAAMLIYLNGNQNRSGNQNRAGHPNQNLARELMELFTMGVGNYTEQDVRQSARAFTGYVGTRPFGEVRIRPEFRDDGAKTFLGQSGDFGGDKRHRHHHAATGHRRLRGAQVLARLRLR